MIRLPEARLYVTMVGNSARGLRHMVQLFDRRAVRRSENWTARRYESLPRAMKLPAWRPWSNQARLRPDTCGARRSTRCFRRTAGPARIPRRSSRRSTAPTSGRWPRPWRRTQSAKACCSGQALRRACSRSTRYPASWRRRNGSCWPPAWSSGPGRSTPIFSTCTGSSASSTPERCRPGCSTRRCWSRTCSAIPSWPGPTSRASTWCAAPTASCWCWRTTCARPRARRMRRPLAGSRTFACRSCRPCVWSWRPSCAS